MSKDLERSIKDRVREIAKMEGRAFNAVWKTLILERFLARLPRADVGENFVFKGGMLLSKYIKLGRETVDLDFLVQDIPASIEMVQSTVANVVEVEARDGFSFSKPVVRELNHIHMEYPGYEINVQAFFGDTRTPLSIDLAVGDRVEKQKKSITFLALKNKPLFESSALIQVYPIEYIFAEKLETAVFRGNVNSRLKDYFDLWTMLKTPRLLDKEKLLVVIPTVFRHRKTALTSLASVTGNAIERFEKDWTALFKNLNVELRIKLPNSFSELVKDLDSWMIGNGLIDSLNFDSVGDKLATNHNE